MELPTLLHKKIIIAALCIGFSLNAMESNNTPNKHRKIWKYIEENKHSPEALGNILIAMAQWKTPDLSIAEQILKLGVSVDSKNSGVAWQGYYGNPGATALATAAYHGKLEYIRLLLDHNANIETKNLWDRRTALMAASMEGHADTVKFLISRGADVNAKSCRGKTSLIWASVHAHAEVVQLLLSQGADIHWKDQDGETALSETQRNINVYRKAQAHWEKHNDSTKANSCAKNARRYKKIKKLLKQADA